MVSASIQPIHVFELAGLGKAPFQYVGNATGGTCCAYCGTSIVNQFVIESADNRRFVVGCECVKKTDDRSLIQSVNRALRDMALTRKRERARSPEELARARCSSIILRHADKLRAIPCNVPATVGPPTLLSWAQWMLSAGAPVPLLRRLQTVLALPLDS